MATKKPKTDAEKRLLLEVESGESLSVREFHIDEAVGELFQVDLLVRTTRADVKLEGLVGQRASLRADSGRKHASDGVRYWTGICSHAELVHAEMNAGSLSESTYALQIVPTIWLLTQRSNFRIFQHKSAPEIIEELLKYWKDWKIEVSWGLDRDRYPKLECKVQYGESDFDFLARIAAEAGMVFTFPDHNKEGSKIRFDDALHRGKVRPEHLQFVDNPGESSEKDFVANVQLRQQVNVGAYVLRDHDFRRPNTAAEAKAKEAKAPENSYEVFDYQPGAFLVEGSKGQDDTPVADQAGKARHDNEFGKALAQRLLDAERRERCKIGFSSNSFDLWPGVIFHMDDHPHDALSKKTKLLVTELSLSGSAHDVWEVNGEAMVVEDGLPYRLPVPAKPVASGVQSAIVVGGKNDEIHCDEFGRVKVQFTWCRTGQYDDKSSCWVRVGQGWAGTGYGMITLPRVGQEVLVSFLEGDPDRPIITGRVFNALQPLPYPLPKHKTRSTWRSRSTPKSEGFNELMFEDLKDQELIYVQAERDLRKVVKNDESITVGHDSKKLVGHDEIESTTKNRVEVTAGDRLEMTDKNRLTVVEKEQWLWVKGNEKRRTEGSLKRQLNATQDVIIQNELRELVRGSQHTTVAGERREKIHKNQSRTVFADQQQKVAKNHLLSAKKEVHIKAASTMVVEAVTGLTLKGPGGFIKLGPGGVTIKGTKLKINCKGAQAGKGSGAKPTAPDSPASAEIESPKKHKVDDVSKTGLAQ